MARQRRHARPKRRRGRFSGLYKVLSILLVAAAVVLACVVFFRVNSVEVEGNVRYTAEDIIEASGIQIGDNLIGLVRSLDDGEAVAFIHYLLVRPEYQKHHIGGSLLTKLLAYYESYLYVKMMPSDKALIPFYEKYGFRIYDNYTAMEIDRL